MVPQQRHSSQSHPLGIDLAAEALIHRLAETPTGQTVQVVAIEPYVLATLAQIKQTLIELQQLPERDAYKQLSEDCNRQRQQLAMAHKQKKQQRDHDRAYSYQHFQGDALTHALSDLTKASQRESTERRRLKREMENAIAPLTDAIAQADQRMQTLKQHYKTISRQWQTHLQLAYRVPKTAAPLHILYQDDCLIVIEKPAGLLSVPGRSYHLQDSVLSRLRHQLLDPAFLQPVHRLDQATSGVLAIALSATAHRALSQQFAQHQVHKTYEAILSRPVEPCAGTIDLPLCPDLEHRPKQRVDFQQGKPSRTDFRRLPSGPRHRVAFVPYTGRTHQLRVHAAHSQGLNSPIVGDTLYGKHPTGTHPTGTHQTGTHQKEKRLYLHATSLELLHPLTQKRQKFISQPPF